MMVDLLVVSNIKPGDEVIKEGSEGDSMYIVAGGATPECVWMCVFLSAVPWQKLSSDVLNYALRLSVYLQKINICIL